jgi:hypothetical protein
VVNGVTQVSVLGELGKVCQPDEGPGAGADEVQAGAASDAGTLMLIR